jgi:hypothetical protein
LQVIQEVAHSGLDVEDEVVVLGHALDFVGVDEK